MRCLSFFLVVNPKPKKRTHAWYGGEEESLSARTFEKHYSTLFPAEITYNVQSGETSFVHFLGGDAYTAPVALINDQAHYLHRDHLGSILAISNSQGLVVEERHFEAWGEIDFFKQNGVETDFSKSILPRGFTGHEHFTEIALIHMNGRMYDPQLRRFLSPDNNIPNPYDTKSFDRMAYVFHSPLGYSDISGEDPLSIIIAVIAVAIVYGSQAKANRNPETGKWNWKFWEWNNSVAIGLNSNGADLSISGGISGIQGQYTPGIDGTNSTNIIINPNLIPNQDFGDLNQNTNTAQNTSNLPPCPYPILPEHCEALGFSPRDGATENNSINNTSISNTESSGGGSISLTVNPIGNGVQIPDREEAPDEEEEEEEKPCPGDPVMNPEIAPQHGQSGIKGALHGCTRYGVGCNSPDGRTKLHNGIDLKNDYGEPIYAMYDGFIYNTLYDKDAGYFTQIQSNINGQTVIIKYFHMQEENRIRENNDGTLRFVSAGDIIGYQGDSGNLKGAIAEGTVDSHVHIEILLHDGSTNWNYFTNFNTVDPRDYLNTTINTAGSSEENTDCN